MCGGGTINIATAATQKSRSERERARPRASIRLSLSRCANAPASAHDKMRRLNINNHVRASKHTFHCSLCVIASTATVANLTVGVVMAVLKFAHYSALCMCVCMCYVRVCVRARGGSTGANCGKVYTGKRARECVRYGMVVGGWKKGVLIVYYAKCFSRSNARARAPHHRTAACIFRYNRVAHN